MITKFINFHTEDNTKLEGLLFLPSEKTNKGVIHIHGLAGNFYENSFIIVQAKYFTDKGIAFFSFNNRGHDYLCDLYKEVDGGKKYFKGGGAYETFIDSIYDINGAINVLKQNNIDSICLQGHSSGANKVVYFMNNQDIVLIKSIILLSPCDDIGLIKNSLGEEYLNKLEKAKKILEESGNILLPKGYHSYPMSVITFLETYIENSPKDIFRYRDTNYTFKEISNIKTPLFVRFGTVNEYILEDINVIFNIFKTNAIKSPLLDIDCIIGASHSYSGKEEELAKETLNWSIKTL